MCGIAGLFDLDAATTSEHLHADASRMAKVLTHRGPDDQGTWVDPRAGVAFGHQRLAIVDLTDAGHQPMTSRDGRWTLTYNGELYNAPELRRGLEGLGSRFRGHADTEVLVEAIAAWGLDEALRRANAMFAIAVWDDRGQELHLVRDRLGEKPLYWSAAGNVILFASELQALRCHAAFDDTIDRDALAAYFRCGFVPAPASIYRGARKLAPGSILTVSRERRDPCIRRYWSLDAVAAEPVEACSDVDAVRELDRLLVDAVALRQHADVPLGAFLSGGIDSSAVVALLAQSSPHPVRTFTVAFAEPGVDESAAARGVASYLGTDHHQIDLTAGFALDAARRVGATYDEPFGDPSSLPTLLMCEAARGEVKVVLSGDGGDETFAGYNRHVLGEAFWATASHVPTSVRSVAGSAIGAVPHTWVQAMTRPANRYVRNPADKIDRLARILPSSGVDDLGARLRANWSEGSGLVIGGRDAVVVPLLPRSGSVAEQLAYIDTLTTLPDDMLVKVDRASMRVALEVRVPLLDHRVVEWAWRRPFALRLRDGTGKWALREVLSTYVPRHLTDRPKMGFDPPLRDWLRGPLREWASGLLAPRRLLAEGYLRPEPVARAWADHQSGRRNRDYQLWSVLAFQTWLEAHHGATLAAR